jgi:pSer/pThr/pTyr-binding forkhead associated (FHA) protein
MKSWVIGSRPDCDVVVDSPVASGRHCQLTQFPDGFFLEDLGSTNGTYVDGNRINVATRISPAQTITLGKTVAMTWPSELVQFVRIGRAAGNDIVLDDARVSSQHARLKVVARSEALIEDLGSANGTYLNSAEERVTRLTSLSSRDTVYFGSLGVPASKLLAGLLDGVAPASASPASTTSKEPRSVPFAAPSTARLIERRRWLLAALLQAPVLAFLIVLTSGSRDSSAVTEENWAAVGQAITATTFVLALAAVWLGCTLGLAELAAARWPNRREEPDLESFFVDCASRLAVLVAACALGCALLLAAVYWGAGLKGPWLQMWGVLTMASTVGLLLGLLVATAVKSWQTVALVLAGCFALMAAFGGWFWPLSARSLPVRLASAATPTRWAFEGVLLLESPQHAAPTTVANPASTPDRDLAEDLFPADSERMGVLADAMALGSMLLGVAAALAFATTEPA